MLVDKIMKTLSKETFDDIDVIIPIPETAVVSAKDMAAKAVAEHMKKPFSTAFIMPGQTARQKSDRRKLSAMDPGHGPRV